jgi:hypothetical protein
MIHKRRRSPWLKPSSFALVLFGPVIEVELHLKQEYEQLAPQLLLSRL